MSDRKLELLGSWLFSLSGYVFAQLIDSLETDYHEDFRRGFIAESPEKLRRLLKEVKLPGKDQSVEFCAALAQAVMRQHFDPIDIVTEVVNRADHALELAIVQGPGKIVCEAAQVAAAAVA